MKDKERHREPFSWWNNPIRWVYRHRSFNNNFLKISYTFNYRCITSWDFFPWTKWNLEGLAHRTVFPTPVVKYANREDVRRDSANNWLPKVHYHENGIHQALGPESMLYRSDVSFSIKNTLGGTGSLLERDFKISLLLTFRIPLDSNRLWEIEHSFPKTL